MYFILKKAGFTVRELVAIATMLRESGVLWVTESSNGDLFWVSLAGVYGDAEVRAYLNWANYQGLRRLNEEVERTGNVEIPCLIAANPTQSELKYVSGVVARNINELSRILGYPLSESSKSILRVSEATARAALKKAVSVSHAMAFGYSEEWPLGFAGEILLNSKLA